MPINRREFVTLVAGAAATSVLATSSLAMGRSSVPKIKAVAFDAFPIFDPRPVFALVEQLFPGHGTELSNAWRTRQFEYTWLRSMMGRYADFWQVTEDSLVFAAHNLKLELTPEKQARLMQAYLELKTWPDVAPALKTLQNLNLRLGVLSNITPKMLNASIANSGLNGVFDQILSTDPVKVYKPDPRAYQIGVDAFGLHPEEILFVAFAGWDAAGAKSFGYSTFWVNRMSLPAEELGVVPDAVGHDLADLTKWILGA
ncbi:MAG TPA: haloacid dehalogenase type II [Opitutaceae bacterium]|jgi:2-haloacid dehalogenase|nr:haloacid dehalogenase type II [Opitutaceae bacterium]